MYDIFGIESYIYHNGDTTSLNFYSSLLCEIFSNILGDGRHNYFISDQIYSLPNEYTIELFYGYACGDGSFSKRNTDNILYF